MILFKKSVSLFSTWVEEINVVMSVNISINWSIWAAIKSSFLGYKFASFPQNLDIAPVCAIIVSLTFKQGNWWKGIIVPSSKTPFSLTLWNSSLVILLSSNLVLLKNNEIF